MKYLNNFLAFIGLFLLNAIYSTLVISILNYFGINILSYSIYKKCLSLILIDISLMVIFYLIFRKELNKELSKYFKHFKRYFFTGLKWWLIGLIVMIVSNVIIQAIYPSVANNEAAIQDALSKSPIYITFSACIFAPFVEEIVFRKSLRKVFTNDVLFVIMSGLFFGLVHNLTNSNEMDFLYMIPYGFFGCTFAYMYVKTNTIFTSMMFHFVHNSILVLISLYSMGVL